MLSWWGMAVLSAIFAVWLHWESGSWRPTKHAPCFAATDIGVMMFAAAAVYATAA